LHGLHYLSRSDMFLGRVRKRENFKFWRYASSLMVCGVLSAKEMQEGKREGWERRKQRYFRSPWQRVRLQEGEDRRSGPMQEELAKKIAAYSKVPRSYALFFVVPFLPGFFDDDRKAAEITTSLRLDVPQIAFLLGDTDKEKAKRIYQDAFAVAAEKRKERVTRVESTVKVEVSEEKRARTTKAETREEMSEEEEEETEMKNQKTLTDFF